MVTKIYKKVENLKKVAKPGLGDKSISCNLKIRVTPMKPGLA